MGQSVRRDCARSLVVRLRVGPIRVAGVAMEPMLRDGNGRSEPPHSVGWDAEDRAFRYPRDTTKSFVMRIVGLPGERIEIRMGTIAINGRAIDDRYVERTESFVRYVGVADDPEGEIS